MGHVEPSTDETRDCDCRASTRREQSIPGFAMRFSGATLCGGKLTAEPVAALARIGHSSEKLPIAMAALDQRARCVADHQPFRAQGEGGVPKAEQAANHAPKISLFHLPACPPDRDPDEHSNRDQGIFLFFLPTSWVTDLGYFESISACICDRSILYCVS